MTFGGIAVGEALTIGAWLAFIVRQYQVQRTCAGPDRSQASGTTIICPAPSSDAVEYRRYQADRWRSFQAGQMPIRVVVGCDSVLEPVIGVFLPDLMTTMPS
jgi:hypothetical protein